jgi:NADPH:quinone reductase-like Zn-dependent oxidoreductase
MRAAVLDRYGPPEVLRVDEVERPAPARGEVLIRVHAATVNRNDCAWRRGSPFVQRAASGWRRPKAGILGNEFAGAVIEVGTEVSRFAPGDEVFGVRAYLSEGFGAQAEYLAVAATSALAHKPANVSFDQGRPRATAPSPRCPSFARPASVLARRCSCTAHRGPSAQPACSSRGTWAPRSRPSPELATSSWFGRSVPPRSSTIDSTTVGKLSHLRMRRRLTPRGAFASTGGLLNFAMVPLTAHSGGRRVIFAPPAFSRQNVEFLADLMASNAYRTVIDRSYPLDEVVQANRYVETERKTGNVVLTIKP